MIWVGYQYSMAHTYWGEVEHTWTQIRIFPKFHVVQRYTLGVQCLDSQGDLRGGGLMYREVRNGAFQLPPPKRLFRKLSDLCCNGSTPNDEPNSDFLLDMECKADVGGYRITLPPFPG